MKYLILTSLLILSGIGYSQDGDMPLDGDALYAAQEYEEDDYDPDFDVVFSTDEDLEDFKKLRMYLKKKENLKASLKSMLSDFSPNDTVELNSQMQFIKSQLDYITGPTSKFHIEIKSPSGTIVYDAETDLIDGEFLTNIIIPTIRGAKESITRILEANETFRTNIKLIDEDIQDCEDQIDIALAPEYKNQEFRAKISFYFTIMIGVLLLGFFLIIAFKSDKTIGREFLGDSGLQFVTMFVLIIAVILFGILGILEGRELTAILSGVSGYILGKGAQAIPKKPATEPAEPTDGGDSGTTFEEVDNGPVETGDDFNFDNSDSGAVG